MIEGLKRLGVVIAAIAILVVAAALIWVVVGWILAAAVVILAVALLIALFNGPVRFDIETGRFSRSDRDGSRDRSDRP